MGQSEENKNEIKTVNNKSKWKYILKNVLFIRIVPIVVIVLMINEGFYKGYEKNPNAFMIILIIKVMLGLGLGVIGGSLEWKLSENLVNGSFRSLGDIKKEYIRIFGVLEFGLVIGICYLRYPAGSILSIIPDIVIWTFIGYLFGLYSWRKVKTKYEKFIQS